MHGRAGRTNTDGCRRTLHGDCFGPVGDYLFNAHGAGTDANKTTRDFALTLHVVDFALTAPAPASLTAAIRRFRGRGISSDSGRRFRPGCGSVLRRLARGAACTFCPPVQYLRFRAVPPP